MATRLPVVRRACCLLVVLAGISPASRSAAQNPRDLVVTLVTRDGRTTFRMGEPIDVELRVRASAPQTYQYHRFTERRAWYNAHEQFVAEPAAGVVDPRADVQYRGASGASGPSLGPFPLGATELVLERQVNDWIRFPAPGHYA